MGEGTGIYYETWGNVAARPLVFVPGLAVDRRIWACQRFAFGRHFRCIAMDNRGSGRSAKPAGPYSLFDMAADIGAVLDAEGVGTAHVVGYSMGSQAASLFALAAPERVATLTLVGSACRHQQWRREMLADWADVATRRGVHAMARRALPWLVGPVGRRFSPAINLLWPALLAQPASAFVAQVDALLAVVDAPIDALTPPTHVVTGAEDRLTPVTDAEEVAALVPGARLSVIGGAGHGVMIEAASDFNDVVLGYLAEATLTVTQEAVAQEAVGR